MVRAFGLYPKGSRFESWCAHMNQKELFMRDEILRNTISAAFGRVGVYKKGKNKREKADQDKLKEDFRKDIGKYLIEIGESIIINNDH